jgi:hypothetical protein
MSRLKIFSLVSYLFFYMPILMLYLYSVLGFEVFSKLGFIAMNVFVFAIGVALNGIFVDMEKTK